jgi:hypothetical protein
VHGVGIDLQLKVERVSNGTPKLKYQELASIP